MAEIPLGDYAGYLFTEMVRAREIGDRYSRALADRYAADDVMRHFSVPRFKIPKMQLTIPVLVVETAVRQLARFTMPEDDFVDLIINRLEFLHDQITAGHHRDLSKATDVSSIARQLHAELVASSDPAHTDSLIASTWPKLVERALPSHDWVATAHPPDRDTALLADVATEIGAAVRQSTTIDSSSIERLMVEPVTHSVRDGSNDSTVFVIAAEMMEDGFYVRSIKDARTGEEQPLVEFD